MMQRETLSERGPSSKICPSSLFQLSEDEFHSILSWLDFGGICRLDVAIGNIAERLLWLKCLGNINNKAINEYQYCHSSIRWLVTRGTRTTSIQMEYFQHNRMKLNDETFLDLDGPSIESLHRNGLNYYILPNGRAHIPASCSLKQTKRLSDLLSITLRDINMISDFSISCIAKSCHSLTSINLNDCVRLTDTCLESIAQGCPHLSSLTLHRLQNVTDNGLSAIANSCHYLKSLDLYHTDKITDVGLSDISRGCRFLNYIVFYRCKYISEL